MVEEYFGKLPQGSPPPAEPAPASQVPHALKKKQSLEQVHLCMGVPAFPIAHPRRYAMYVLSTLLGGGMSSRLFQNVREKHGLAYSIFSELSLYRDTGCLAVYSGTSDVHIGRVIGMITDEFKRLVNEEIPADELRRAKDHMKGSLALSLESTSARMSNLARQELFFGRFFSVDEMVEEIEKVTTEDVMNVARDLFAGRQAGVAVLGRTGSLELDPAALVC
jgi:predicted Zn-dependent peptidase